MTRIVGIMLVKDEDLYVEQAVRNVLAFCDEIFLADNGSRDETLAVLERLVAEHREDYAWESRPSGASTVLPTAKQPPGQVGALTGRPAQLAWKLYRYRQEPYVTADADGFFALGTAHPST
jgi:glycosyltransferase involved in cell wall biosynthesis